MKKIIPYILLNIVISAATMLAVILIWNASHPNSPEQIDPNEFFEATSPESTSEPLPDVADKTVEIQSVFMPGELDFEKVTIKCVSSAPIDLSGWTLNDAQGHQFVFPALTIFPNGAVDIYSKSGGNSAVELFWNSPEAVWASGEKISIRDTAGNIRTTFIVP